MESITSRQNPTVVRLSKLSDKKYRDAEGLFLAEGIKLAGEAVSAGVVKIMLALPELAGTAEVNAAAAAGAQIIAVSAEVLNKISTESAPQGIIAVCRTIPELHYGGDFAEPSKFLSDDKFTIILDRIRDPGNLGAIMRSAEAFGGVRLILAGCADVYNPRTVRGSMGAVFRLPTVSFSNAADAVSFAGSVKKRILGAALDKTAIRLECGSIDANTAVIIGNEGSGIDKNILDMCDGKLYIPMTGGESLNCAVAASIIMWCAL